MDVYKVLRGCPVIDILVLYIYSLTGLSMGTSKVRRLYYNKP